MRFLDEMELFLTEEKDSYNLYPVDFDAESGTSFGVDLSDKDNKTLAKIAIKLIDGTSIDALNGNYNYKDVYADVDLEGDVDDPTNADLMLWILKKLKNMGYDEQTIRFDGEDYYTKPENLSDVTTDDDEPAQSDDDIDASSYWEGDEDENSEGESSGGYKVPDEDNQDGEEETDGEATNPFASNPFANSEENETETSTDDEEEDDEDEDKKKYPWEK